MKKKFKENGLVFIDVILKTVLFLCLLYAYLKNISYFENIITVVPTIILSIPIIAILLPIISIKVVDKVSDRWIES